MHPLGLELLLVYYPSPYFLSYFPLIYLFLISSLSCIQIRTNLFKIKRRHPAVDITIKQSLSRNIAPLSNPLSTIIITQDCLLPHLIRFTTTTIPKGWVSTLCPWALIANNTAYRPQSRLKRTDGILNPFHICRRPSVLLNPRAFSYKKRGLTGPR